MKSSTLRESLLRIRAIDGNLANLNDEKTKLLQSVLELADAKNDGAVKEILVGNILFTIHPRRTSQVGPFSNIDASAKVTHREIKTIEPVNPVNLVNETADECNEASASPSKEATFEYPLQDAILLLAECISQISPGPGLRDKIAAVRKSVVRSIPMTRHAGGGVSFGPGGIGVGGFQSGYASGSGGGPGEAAIGRIRDREQQGPGDTLDDHLRTYHEASGRAAHGGPINDQPPFYRVLDCILTLADYVEQLDPEFPAKPIVNPR